MYAVSSRIIRWLARYIAKPYVLSVLKRVSVGSLNVVDGRVGTFDNSDTGTGASKLDDACVGDGEPEDADDALSATLIVNDDTFWFRVLLFSDMGFAESFLSGELDCADLTSVFKIYILNRNRLDNQFGVFAGISDFVMNLAPSRNTVTGSQKNISAHYDLSNDVFAAFLSPDMTYSCPIWRQLEKTGDEERKETLQSAQMRKLQHVIESARITSTDHVLEIGTGWASFAIEAVLKTGCRVTTLTLSQEQKLLAEKKIQDAGLFERISVLLMDYRCLPVPETRYDKIVSLEMIEHVGQEYLATYFACINRLLKPTGGIAVFQSTVMPEGRALNMDGREKAFVTSYIFPGGYVPSTRELLDHIREQSSNTLAVESVDDVGLHYVKALQIWRDNYLSNFDRVIRPALVRRHGDMPAKALASEKRKWEYYFRYTEAGFDTGILGNSIITVVRD